MPTEKLTDRRVKTVRVPPGGARLELWDLNMPGLGLRVAPDGPQGEGGKTWFVRYRFGGQQRRHKLGTYPALLLSDAHKAARDLFKAVAAGEDPAAEKAPAAPVDTFDSVADEFVKRHVKVALKPRSAREVERILNVDLRPHWGTRPIQAITKRDVIELLDRIVDRGAPVHANRTLAVARKLFNWAIGRDLMATSPCDRLKPPSVETERQRVLSDEEIALVWRAAGACAPAFGPMVRICLLTAQRRGETSVMRWADVDLERKVWTIPREVTKGDRGHEVPLSDLAVAIIDAQPRLGVYVFPGRSAGCQAEETANAKKETPFSGFSRAKERLDNLVLESLRKAAKQRGEDPEKVKPLPDWTLHDLRRTAATGMARIGIPRLIISKIENHAEGGVTRIYDRYAYEKEKREALGLWAEKVRSIVEPPPDNVVQLRRAADA